MPELVLVLGSGTGFLVLGVGQTLFSEAHLGDGSGIWEDGGAKRMFCVCSLSCIGETDGRTFVERLSEETQQLRRKMSVRRRSL